MREDFIEDNRGGQQVVNEKKAENPVNSMQPKIEEPENERNSQRVAEEFRYSDQGHPLRIRFLAWIVEQKCPGGNTKLQKPEEKLH